MPVGSQPNVKVARVGWHVTGGKRKLDEKAETTVKEDERHPYLQGHGNSNPRMRSVEGRHGRKLWLGMAKGARAACARERCAHS